MSDSNQVGGTIAMMCLTVSGREHNWHISRSSLVIIVLMCKTSMTDSLLLHAVCLYVTDVSSYWAAGWLCGVLTATFHWSSWAVPSGSSRRPWSKMFRMLVGSCLHWVSDHSVTEVSWYGDCHLNVTPRGSVLRHSSV